MSKRVVTGNARDLDVGTQHALPSRLSTVHVAGSARGLTVTFHPPALPAGAEPAVPDPSDAVAAVPAVLDTDRGAADRDRVEHERQARLRRWQAIG